MSVPPTAQWPLRPDAQPARRDLAAELLELERHPGSGKLSGLSNALADWLGVDVLLVRTLIVLASLSAGIGVLAYLAGWLLTRDAGTHLAPLDKVSSRWRKLSPRTVVGWTAVIVALLALTFGSSIGFGWLPLIIIAVTIWTGIKAPKPQPQPRIRHYLYPPGAAPGQLPAATAAPRPARSTLVITLITLSIAVLTAGAVIEQNPRNLLLAAALALLAIGVGLLVAAGRGVAVPLVAAGIVVAVLTGALMLSNMTSLRPPASQVLTLASPQDLVPSAFSGENTVIDLSQLPVIANTEWPITASKSSLYFTAPTDQNVRFVIDYTDSMVRTGGQLDFGSGQAQWESIPKPDAPTLVINIRATKSLIEVTS